MKTELARTATGDVLYHQSSGCCFMARADGVIEPVSKADVIEALIAINAGQRLFQHWDLATDDINYLCRLVNRAGAR